MLKGQKLAVLHLRQSSGGGGGADSVLCQQVALASRSDRIQPLVAYLRKPQHQLAGLREAIEAANVPFFEVPGRAWLDPRQFLRLLRLVDGHKVQVVHSHDPKADLLARLLRRLRPNLKLAATLHGWTGRGWKGRGYRRLDALALRQIDLVVAVSSALKVQAQSLGIDKVKVVPNAVNLDYWQSTRAAARTPFTVLFSGRLSAEKAPLDAIRVAAQLPEAHLVIAGDGPERGAVEALIRQERLTARITLAGHVPRNQLRQLFEDADAVLLTSRTEGLPMVLLEAGAMQRPAVATRVGGVSEVIIDGETGLMVAPGDIEAMVTALNSLATNPERAALMGRNARQWILTEFNEDTNWRRMEALYLAFTQ